jgi:starch-binding outer membrane protein, SusD/RagB family
LNSNLEFYFLLIKIDKMKQIIKYISILSFTAIIASCGILEVEKVPDLNNPTIESVLTNATLVQISQLGVGAQLALRTNYYDLCWIGGSIGREIIVFNSTDSRYYTELLGASAISPSGIFFPWYNGFNATRRRAEIFTRSADNSKALNAAEKNACKGFAKTVQAFVMLNCLNMMPDVGIRTELGDALSDKDLLNPGPFVDYAGSLTYCKKLIDDGASALDAGGTAFPFPMTSGWGDFSTPATFKKFNRAVAARIAMYQKDWAGMNTALQGSYLNLTGSLSAGPVFTYSTTAGDASNPFFLSLASTAPNTSHRDWLAQAEAGDKRVFGTSARDGGTSKIKKRAAALALGGIPANEYDFQPVPSNIASFSIIRNEELVLMHAEAQAQLNNLGVAVSALDSVRVSAGLGKLATAKPTVVGDKAKIIDEILNQRRYSLYMEGGHRWFDMRRYDRLATLPKDLPSHVVIRSFPKPQAEMDWDARPK